MVSTGPDKMLVAIVDLHVNLGLLVAVHAIPMVVAPVVGVGRQSNLLRLITRDLKLVYVVFCVVLFPYSLAIDRFIVVFEQKPSVVHPLHVQTDVRRLHLLNVIFECHKILAIVLTTEMLRLISQIVGPKIT